MHDGEVEADDQGSELADARPGGLDAVQLSGDGHLVALLVGVGAVRVGEVDVAVGLRHHAPNRVSALRAGTDNETLLPPCNQVQGDPVAVSL